MLERKFSGKILKYLYQILYYYIKYYKRLYSSWEIKVTKIYIEHYKLNTLHEGFHSFVNYSPLFSHSQVASNFYRVHIPFNLYM